MPILPSSNPVGCQPTAPTDLISRHKFRPNTALLMPILPSSNPVGCQPTAFADLNLMSLKPGIGCSYVGEESGFRVFCNIRQHSNPGQTCLQSDRLQHNLLQFVMVVLTSKLLKAVWRPTWGFHDSSSRQTQCFSKFCLKVWSWVATVDQADCSWKAKWSNGHWGGSDPDAIQEPWHRVG